MYRARLKVQEENGELVELEVRTYEGTYTQVCDRVFDTMVQDALDAGFPVEDVFVDVGDFRMKFA